MQQSPARLSFGAERYRRRPATRNKIATLFGSIELRRIRYEPLETGEASIFPLEIHLGIEAGLATPALAEQVGLWSVDHSQQQVLALLQHHQEVRWSVTSLRKLTRSLCEGMTSFRQSAQEEQLLKWLAFAHKSQGFHPVVLAVGRDGVMVPIRNEGYQEASTATLSVYTRTGKRLGTVYLGQMPQPGQGGLSSQLTDLLKATLGRWQRRGGRKPRLVYLTDRGYHQHDYYHKVLKKLADPWQPGKRLTWEWVLDFFHVVTYVAKLADAIFSKESKRSLWFTKMRHWLRCRVGGISNLLRSALCTWDQAKKTKAREKEFWQAYRFLRRNSPHMKYAGYRQEGLPIGSGVTEAACKTVFSQRLKCSGMTWKKESGQVIVDLRVIRLSGVWQEVHQSYLQSHKLPKTESGNTLL